MNGMSYEHLRWQTRNNVLIVEIVTPVLHGDLIEQQLCDELLTVWQQAQASHVVLNLAAVQYLTSAVLRAFITLRRHVKHGGGRVILCNVHGQDLLKILTTARLITTSGSTPHLFEFTPDLETALAQLETGATTVFPESGPRGPNGR
ncbi:MAG: STAS domain-containing protein [Gemmatales bacterium]|nr:STAS domain-containing protein [Gemmatales bacterium]MDW7994159.1 STAS domain-containing protein [Gemmatales bacterium]